MAKFIIECPSCGTLNPASTFIFAKKAIKCGNCSAELNVKEHKLASRKCPFCQNIFLYDQTKRRNICPACKKDISSGFSNLISFPCPDCGCTMHVESEAKTATCPVCDKYIDSVEREAAKAGLVSDTKLSVIKYEGDNSTFVWKHPIEDFNIGSQLIVHESQEAVLFINGQMVEPVFTPGRHTLKTENIPFLRKLFDFVMDGDPFHAEVYFINKTVQMSIPWGTPEKIHITDPLTDAVLEIGAFGEMNLQVTDSAALLRKIVGTTNGIAWKDQSRFADSLEKAFRPLISLAVKSNLPAVIREQQIDILKIDEKLEMISSMLREVINSGFSEYGLVAPQFYIRGIAYPPENDSAFKIIKELHNEKLRHMAEEYEAGLVVARRKVVTEQQETALQQERFEAERKRIAAQAEADAMTLKGSAGIELKRQQGLADAEIMAAKGYNQKDVLDADVKKAFAEGLGNMGSGISLGGSGGVMSEVVGLGVGLSAMGMVSEAAGNALHNVTKPVKEENAENENSWTCSCGHKNTGKFCAECGKAKPEVWDCVCGNKGNSGKFCSECGKPKPEAWDCPNCGNKGNSGKFCSECGKPKA